jgi:LysM repeat protein
MKRHISRPLFITVLSSLAILVSACNWTSAPAAPDYNATATVFSESVLTRVAALPTPTLESSPTPSPTLDPVFQTVTAQSTFIVTPGPRPLYYTLQIGEFPYCIARRLNIDPKELLTLNNLPSGLIYAPGLILSIPQSGLPFPSPRALRPHPTTYTVPESQMTVYKVACQFGDVDPLLIMQYNGLTSPILTIGMTLQIP